MTICEHCHEEIEPMEVTESTGGHYGDTYASDTWTEQRCPKCWWECETVHVEGELGRRYYQRFGKVSLRG